MSEFIEKALRVPYRSYGGSATYARKLSTMLPKHSRYVECFCGSAAVFFAKEPAKHEILADANPDVIFALKYIQKLDDEKLKQLKAFSWVVSRDGLKRARAYKPKSDAGRFWKFVFNRLASWSGDITGGYAANHEGKSYPVDELSKFRDRLKGVTIEQADWLQTISKYDSSDTLFFVDPPYEDEWRGGDAVPADKITERLGKLKGMWIAAYTDSNKARKAFRSIGKLFILHISEVRGAGGGQIRPRLFATNHTITKVKSYSLEPEIMHFTSDWNPEILKAVTTRDSVQIWDPDKKDPDADRTELRPLAFFQPMKPTDRPTNDLNDIDDALKHFATPGSLAVGIAVEPKWNGFRVVAEKKDDRVLIYTEDKWKDMSPLLPSVVKEMKSIDGDFILDAELLAFENNKPLPRRDLAQFRGKEPADDSGVRLRVFDALWLPKGGNLTATHYDDMRKQLSAWFKGKGYKHIEESPYKIARNEKQLRDLMINWAAKQPGSEGAMLKLLTSTYSLSGQTSSWCLPSYQKIYTPDGWRRIDEIKKGDLVLSGNAFKPIPVLDTISYEHEGELMRINASQLGIIDASSNHRFLVVRRGWKRLKNDSIRRRVRRLREKQGSRANLQRRVTDDFEAEWLDAREIRSGDCLVFPKLKTMDSETIAANRAELLGWCVAEGHSDHPTRYRIGLGKDAKHDIERIKRLITRSFWNIANKIHIGSNDKGHRITIKSRRITDWIVSSIGNDAYDKRIPSFILQSPENVTKAFLKGYWRGDGAIQYSGHSFGTASKRLAFDLRILFTKLGILAGIHKEKKIEHYRVNVSSVADNFLKARFKGSPSARERVRERKCRAPASYREVNGHLLVKVQHVETVEYKGKLHHIQTADETFIAGAVTHNSKWKTTRITRAIVYDRHPVSGSPGMFNLFCAVGPVQKPEEWKETVEVKGKTYTVIGKTGNAKLIAEKGDTIVTEIIELFHETDPGEKMRLQWSGPPVVVSKTNQAPMRVEEVTDLLQEWEIKKQLDSEKVHKVRFLPETIQKAKNDERYVLGIVLEPEVADAQGDIYSADEIKRACHTYMAKWRNRGFMHRIPVNDAVDLIENIFVHPEMELKVSGKAIKKGTWLAGFHLHGDEYWNKTKRGEITGLSIGGTAEKEPVK